MKKEMKYTPGPWQCEDDQGKFFDTDWSADYEGDESTGMETTVPVLAGETTVALIVYQNTSFDEEELEANARLIAAAPQMKSLIDKAVDALATYIVPDSGITEHDLVNTLLGIFDGPEYRAVMAKITGQAA